MTSGVISIASVASFFVGLKPFRPIRTIAGLWDVGKEGDSDPGEIDATRVNQYQTGQSEPPSAHGLVCTPSASDGHPTPGGGGEGRLELCLLPGRRRPSGPIT